MSNDRVVELNRDVVELTLDSIRKVHPHEIRGCAAMTIDREGNYSYSICGMTGEQVLASAELLRETALHMLWGGDDE